MAAGVIGRISEACLWWPVVFICFILCSPSPNKVDSVLRLSRPVYKYLLKDCEQMDYDCVRKHPPSKLSFVKRINTMKKSLNDHCSLKRFTKSLQVLPKYIKIALQRNCKRFNTY